MRVMLGMSVIRLQMMMSGFGSGAKAAPVGVMRMKDGNRVHGNAAVSAGSARARRSDQCSATARNRSGKNARAFVERMMLGRFDAT